MDYWRIAPGRLEDALSLYLDLRRVNDQLGAGDQRLWRCLIGGNESGEFYSTVDFPSMAALGEFGVRWTTAEEAAATAARLDAPGSPMAGIRTTALRELADWGSDINDRGTAGLLRMFRMRPDRWSEFFEIVETSAEHALRYGAIAKLYQVKVGGDLVGRMVTEVVFPNMAALGSYMNEFDTDPELRSFRDRVLGPETPARLLTTSINHDVFGEQI